MAYTELKAYFQPDLVMNYNPPWNRQKRFTNLDSGLEALFTGSKSTAMLVIHQTWCGQCKNLQDDFENARNSAALEIKALSSDFVMISCANENEPMDDKYRPDGAYYPRIFFLQRNDRGTFPDKRGHSDDAMEKNIEGVLAEENNGNGRTIAVLDDVYNSLGNQEYRYFYATGEQVLVSMQQVHKKYVTFENESSDSTLLRTNELQSSRESELTPKAITTTTTTVAPAPMFPSDEL